MNKILATEPHLLMSIVGPSGSGKTLLLSKLLLRHEELFNPPFQKIVYFYKHWQPIYSQIQVSLGSRGIQFICGVNWAKIDALLETVRHLLIFDDVYTDIADTTEFLNLVVSGRHRNLHAIFLKHNLYHKSKNSKTIDLNITHLILLKNPRDINQIDHLGRQLGCRRILIDSYRTATLEPFGHLLIDLSPHCCDLLRLASNITEETSIFYASDKHKKIIHLNAIKNC